MLHDPCVSSGGTRLLIAAGEAVADLEELPAPLTAFADAVRAFQPDHILVGLRASDHAAWQERGLIDAVIEAFHLPVTVFEVDRAGQ